MRGIRCAVAAVIAVACGLLPATWSFAASGYSQVALELGPAAYWRLGETSGTTAVDSSPHGRNATYQGAPQLGLPGAIAADPNTSVGFDGRSNDAVWFPTSSYQGAFTVVAWLDHTGSTGFPEQTFFDTRTASGEYSFDFKLSNGNLKVDVGNGTQWFLSGPGLRYDFRLNTWYQVAAAITDTAATLYVDGRSIGSEPYPFGTGFPLLYDPTHPVYLATNPRYTVEPFLGRLDEVAIYPRPLPARDIELLHRAGTAGGHPLRATAVLAWNNLPPALQGSDHGYGYAALQVNGDRVCFGLRWANLTTPTGAYLHPVSAIDSQVTVQLFAGPPGPHAADRTAWGCVTTDPAVAADLAQCPQNYSLTVTTQDTFEAIGGQLRPA